MKVYARVKPNSSLTVFYSPNISHAVSGFMEMGFEIVPYRTISEIYDKVTSDDIVLDGITQCLTIFDKFGMHPHLEDYPEVLKPFLGRVIWIDTINRINSRPDKWGIFVKPIKQKAFTGKVINSPRDLMGCGSCYENYDVYCSEILDIKREWRGFILYDKLIDIRPYTGDYHYQYNPDIIDSVINAFKTWDERPSACSIDFAVVQRGNNLSTIVLEVNDAYSLGNYGLRCIDYAKMVSARWSQLLNRVDECKF